MKHGVLGMALVSIAVCGCTQPSRVFTDACVDAFQDTVGVVIDGDTLDFARCGRIRLALVDTPERGAPGFENATNFTATLCAVGAVANVDLDSGQPRDTTGTRLVGIVVCGGKNLNAELVGAGHAVVLTEFCGISEFADDEWVAPYCG